MSGTQRQVDRDDSLFLPFWEGTEARELRVQQCGQCGRHRWPPRPICTNCQSMETKWVAVEPRGALYSWTVVGHQTVAGVAPPYAVGLVELPDIGVRLLGQIVGIEPSQLAIGMALRATFEASGAGVTLCNWTPDPA
jgi:uncharacterized OB-fold protein